MFGFRFRFASVVGLSIRFSCRVMAHGDVQNVPDRGDNAHSDRDLHPKASTHRRDDQLNGSSLPFYSKICNALLYRGKEVKANSMLVLQWLWLQRKRVRICVTMLERHWGESARNCNAVIFGLLSTARHEQTHEATQFNARDALFATYQCLRYISLFG